VIGEISHPGIPEATSLVDGISVVASTTILVIMALVPSVRLLCAAMLSVALIPIAQRSIRAG